MNVKCKVLDGVAPIVAGEHALYVKLSSDVTFDRKVLKLPSGVKFDVPVMLVAAKHLKEVKLLNSGMLFLPNEEPYYELEYQGEVPSTFFLERGQSVALAVPFGNKVRLKVE